MSVLRVSVTLMCDRCGRYWEGSSRAGCQTFETLAGARIVAEKEDGWHCQATPEAVGYDLCPEHKHLAARAGADASGHCVDATLRLNES